MFTKTILFEIDYDQENECSRITEIDATIFLNPFNGKKTYLVNYDEDNFICDEVIACYEHDLKERDLYLTRLDAENVILQEEFIESHFEEKCIEFINLCKKYGKRNPFIRIGEYLNSKENKEAIDKIVDPVYKYFFKDKIYYISMIDDLEEILIDEINRK
jgi:hypothetical protein